MDLLSKYLEKQIWQLIIISLTYLNQSPESENQVWQQLLASTIPNGHQLLTRSYRKPFVVPEQL
jgi:hypothetical protein